MIFVARQLAPRPKLGRDNRTFLNGTKKNESNKKGKFEGGGLMRGQFSDVHARVKSGDSEFKLFTDQTPRLVKNRRAGGSS